MRAAKMGDCVCLGLRMPLLWLLKSHLSLNTTSLRASVMSSPPQSCLPLHSAPHHGSTSISCFFMFDTSKSQRNGRKQLFPFIYLLRIKLPFRILGCSEPSRWKVRPGYLVIWRRRNGGGGEKAQRLSLGRAEQATWRLPRYTSCNRKTSISLHSANIYSLLTLR